MLYLANQAEKYVWECIESRIVSDDQGNIYMGQYWTTLEKKTGEGKRNTTINIKIGGNIFTSMAVIGGKLVITQNILIMYIRTLKIWFLLL